MEQVRIGSVSVSKFIIGGNPFSGMSHQGAERDRDMQAYYTAARIKETLRRAESLGINTFIGRADGHIARLLIEYWDEGGTIQWIAQTCPEFGNPAVGAARAISQGAKACYIHGGQADTFLYHNRLAELIPVVAAVREAGLPAGIAGHTPRVHEWAKEELDLDFHMCAYYDPVVRDETGAQVPGTGEEYRQEHRDRMMKCIHSLPRPAIHYKVLAAGRNEPAEAFAYVARHLRPQDAVCVGVFTRDNPKMLEEDIRLLAEAQARGNG